MWHCFRNYRFVSKHYPEYGAVYVMHSVFRQRSLAFPDEICWGSRLFQIWFYLSVRTTKRFWRSLQGVPQWNTGGNLLSKFSESNRSDLKTIGLLFIVVLPFTINQTSMRNFCLWVRPKYHGGKLFV